MARPVGADAEETRQRLVAAAARRFAEVGVAATPLRAVAADAGVSLATIHHYFGGKQALVEATADAVYGDLADALPPLERLLEGLTKGVSDAEPGALAETVAALVRDTFRSARANRPALQMLMRGAVSDGALDARWRDGALLPFLRRAADALGAATGRDPEAVRLDLLSLNALGTRFALCSVDELTILAGLLQPGVLGGATAHEAAVDRFERHLADLAVRVVLGEPR